VYVFPKTYKLQSLIFKKKSIIQATEKQKFAKQTTNPHELSDKIISEHRLIPINANI
jgi:hypothetical protein